jgi:hypothetical protein
MRRTSSEPRDCVRGHLMFTSITRGGCRNACQTGAWLDPATRRGGERVDHAIRDGLPPLCILTPHRRACSSWRARRSRAFNPDAHAHPSESSGRRRARRPAKEAIHRQRVGRRPSGRGPIATLARGVAGRSTGEGGSAARSPASERRKSSCASQARRDVELREDVADMVLTIFFGEVEPSADLCFTLFDA